MSASAGSRRFFPSSSSFRSPSRLVGGRRRTRRRPGRRRSRVSRSSGSGRTTTSSATSRTTTRAVGWRSPARSVLADLRCLRRRGPARARRAQPRARRGLDRPRARLPPPRTARPPRARRGQKVIVSDVAGPGGARRARGVGPPAHARLGRRPPRRAVRRRLHRRVRRPRSRLVVCVGGRSAGPAGAAHQLTPSGVGTDPAPDV